MSVEQVLQVFELWRTERARSHGVFLPKNGKNGFSLRCGKSDYWLDQFLADSGLDWPLLPLSDEAAFIAVFFASRPFDLVYANPAFAQLLCADSVDMLLGRPALELVRGHGSRLSEHNRLLLLDMLANPRSDVHREAVHIVRQDGYHVRVSGHARYTGKKYHRVIVHGTPYGRPYIYGEEPNRATPLDPNHWPAVEEQNLTINTRPGILRLTSEPRLPESLIVNGSFNRETLMVDGSFNLTPPPQLTVGSDSLQFFPPLPQIPPPSVLAPKTKREPPST